MSAMAKNSGPLWALEDSRTLWVLFPSGETQGKEHDVMTSATFSHAVTWIKCRIDMGGGGGTVVIRDSAHVLWMDGAAPRNHDRGDSEPSSWVTPGDTVGADIIRVGFCPSSLTLIAPQCS